MGTVLELSVHEPGNPQLLTSLFERVSTLEKILTRFDPTSDLSRLNSAAGPNGTVATRPMVAASIGGDFRRATEFTQCHNKCRFEQPAVLQIV